MMYSNPGFAMGTSIGATLTTIDGSGSVSSSDTNRLQYTMEDDGYFLIAQARTIPNGETDPQLPTPTGFTKLNERVIVNGQYTQKTTALGVYIKECSAGEVMTASLAPDSRNTLIPVEVVSTNYPNRYVQLQDLRFQPPSDTSCARCTLGLSANTVYGFDLEYMPESSGASGGAHDVIMATSQNGFRLLRDGSSGFKLFVRDTLVYSNNNILSTYEWNTISLKNNKLTINGVDVHNIDTSQAIDTYSTSISLFGYSNYNDWNYTSGWGRVRRVTLYRANDSYVYLPAYDDGYGMFNITTQNFYSATISYEAFVSGYNYAEQQYPLSTTGPINNGIYGDLVGVPIYGAQRYEFSTDWNDIGSYEKEGRYASIYFALSDPLNGGNIVKEGNDFCYFTRPPYIDDTNHWYNGRGAAGLVGGFSPDMASGVYFNSIHDTSYSEDPLISFEVRFFDENSKINETFGSIIRNGIRYTPDIKKLIPTYNGTFINDFRVLYDYSYKTSGEEKHETIEAIKFITPSAVSSIGYYPYSTLQFKYINMQFCHSSWNIFSDQLGKIGPKDYHNIVLGGRILTNVKYNDAATINKPITGNSIGNYYSDSYANVILGEYNYAYSSGSYLSGRIILGRNNKSYMKGGDTHWIIGEGNSLLSYDYLFCAGYGNKIDLWYDYPGNSVLGAYNAIFNATSDPGTYGMLVAGTYNTLETHYGSQSIIGYSNKLYDHKDVTFSYNVGGVISTSSYDDDIGRYGVLVSGRDNEVHGGTTACIGYYNVIQDDIGYNDTTTVLDSSKNGMVYASRGVIGSNNVLAGVLFAAGADNNAKAISTVLGERNYCNWVETYGTYVTPGIVVSTDYLIRRGQILGSFNQVNSSGTIVGFANRANRVKAIFGSDNYVDLDTQPAVSSMIFGDRNRLVTSPNSHIFGSENDVSRYNQTNTGVQIYGSENNGTINYTIYGIHNYSGGSVGFVYGSYNNLTATIESVYGSYNTISNSSISYALIGDYNNVSGSCLTLIGNNNQTNSMDSCLGSYNTVSYGSTAIGFHNSVSSGSYVVGDSNTINSGSKAFGCGNVINSGGSYYIMGYSNTIEQSAGGSGPIFGNNNTITGGMNSFGIIGNSNTVGPGATAIGNSNNVNGGATAIGNGNTIDWGTIAIGVGNQVTSGGGHYILGVGNNATNTSTQLIGFYNTISGGLAIGKYLTSTDNNSYRITIGAYNDPNVDPNTRVVFGDGTYNNDLHNLFYSTASHDTYFSGHVYSTNVPDAPNTPGVYILKCTVTINGEDVIKTYEWINSNNESVNEIDVNNSTTYNKEKGIMEIDDGALIGSTSVTVSSVAGTITGGKDTEITIPIKKQFDTVTEVTLS